MFLCMYRLRLVVYSSIGGHLGSFYLLAIMNSADTNVAVQTSLYNPDFNSSVYILRSGIARSYGSSI